MKPQDSLLIGVENKTGPSVFGENEESPVDDDEFYDCISRIACIISKSSFAILRLEERVFPSGVVI